MNKEYKIKIERDRDIYLSVTHNGYQWSSINIKEPEIEIPKIIEILKNYLTKMEVRRLIDVTRKNIKAMEKRYETI